MLIDDQLLSPYKIIIDQTSCTVVEPIGKKDAKGNDINKIHGYYGAIEDALYKVAKLKVIDSADSMTIKTYVTELRTIKNELLTLIDID